MVVRTDNIIAMIKKRFGGATPEFLLHPDTFAALHANSRKIRFWFNAVFTPLLLSAFVLLSWLAVSTCKRMDGAPQNPVFDARTVVVTFMLPVIVIVAVWYLGGLIYDFTLPRVIGWNSDLWRRYYATRHGWQPQRRWVFMSILFVPFLSITGLLVWHVGACVDERGIAFGTIPPFSRVVHSYSDVSAVELYTGWANRFGAVTQEPVLLVRFSDGDMWEHSAEADAPASPRRVAEFIAARSHAQIAEGGVRPF